MGLVIFLLAPPSIHLSQLSSKLLIEECVKLYRLNKCKEKILMAIDVSWYIQSRVIRIHAYGETPSIEDIQRVSSQVQALFDAGTTPVHILLDDEDAGALPASVSMLKDTLNFTEEYISQAGWVVGVGKPPIVAKVVFPLLMKIVRASYVRVATIEDAIQFLSSKDETLSISE
jgi:hypothetical protein